MKFKIKKYIYLLNDFTNALLKKDRDLTAEQIKQLHRLLLVVTIILALSLALNAYLIIIIQ